MLLLIETEGGVVDLLEPPVSEEATPLPSSHDVLVQSMRLHKALNRLGLVTQQVGNSYKNITEVLDVTVSPLTVQMWCQDWNPPYPALWQPALVLYHWQHPQVICINSNTFLYNACVYLL